MWQAQISEVLDAMFQKCVSAGEHVIEQNDDGDNFYVIESWVHLTSFTYNLSYNFY